ncbi:MAG: DUF1614 domain-containing protein [Bacillota bacterium]
MDRLPIGVIILIVVSVLIYLGLLQRILDRMRLTDRAALVIVGAMVVGSLIDIPIPAGRNTVALNVGGAIVPVALAVYLLSRADEAAEKTRALLGALITGAVVYGVGTFIMTGLPEPAGRYAFIDVLYLYPIVAAVIAYTVGRSRRASFVAAILGVLLADVFHWTRLVATRTPGSVHIGGAGAFDTIVVSGLLAVLLAEVVGEIRERIQGGPRSGGRSRATLDALKTPEEGGQRDEDR